MNTKEILANIEREIEKTEKEFNQTFIDDEWAPNLEDISVEHLKLKAKKQGLLLGVISQLKEEKNKYDILKEHYEFVDSEDDDNKQYSMGFTDLYEAFEKIFDINQITADLKFYEDKLKEMEK